LNPSSLSERAIFNQSITICRGMLVTNFIYSVPFGYSDKLLGRKKMRERETCQTIPLAGLEQWRALHQERAG
jgi:hypothetical protein